MPCGWVAKTSPCIVVGLFARNALRRFSGLKRDIRDVVFRSHTSAARCKTRRAHNPDSKMRRNSSVKRRRARPQQPRREACARRFSLPNRPSTAKTVSRACSRWGVLGQEGREPPKRLFRGVRDGNCLRVPL
ncbi:hypothetical protein TraAM80_08907 [Trypanosoma rangeli]|uniref:Uncharacterized protein n=1 Tax=Trypanosoma rangeli TaxID=5698 RepID=A0A3R7R984_TRYRA|nr:uncharacterized protein TraAM80_08907 [Trypanosoma rangeli]RNE98195.1 hypothetical protein TraAM80_08907 [Trypanosoma rangeli]|eukprot:RNE98195.1 hypothetical protein TraAM80_08907 [Trypanosoma rangeli]